MARALAVRLLQVIALYAPGSMTTRPRLHRIRGVDIGREVFIGTDVILETSRPELISIGNRVTISIRVTMIAHFHGALPKRADKPSGNRP